MAMLIVTTGQMKWRSCALELCVQPNSFDVITALVCIARKNVTEFVIVSIHPTRQIAAESRTVAIQTNSIVATVEMTPIRIATVLTARKSAMEFWIVRAVLMKTKPFAKMHCVPRNHFAAITAVVYRNECFAMVSLIVSTAAMNHMICASL